MLLVPRHVDALDGFAQRIRLADGPSRELVRAFVAGACARVLMLKAAGKATRLEKWIDAGAWTEVALELVALELPAWSVRRLARDDGIWFCSLSRSPNLPVELDDAVEASHETMPLAILTALVEARRAENARVAFQKPASVPPVREPTGHRICCDNFS